MESLNPPWQLLLSVIHAAVLCLGILSIGDAAGRWFNRVPKSKPETPKPPCEPPAAAMPCLRCFTSQPSRN